MYYIDKIKLHLSNWWFYFLEHLVRFIFLSFIMAGLCYVFSRLPVYNIYDEYGQLTDQHVMIIGITLENWSIFFTIIGLILTAIWGIYQYDKNKKLKQQEKGAEIAKLFSDELLDKCYIIGHVINQSELGKLLDLKNVDMNNLKRFDKEEITELYKDNVQFWEKYENNLISDDLQLYYFYLLESRISTKTFNEIKYKNKNNINKTIIKIMSKKFTKDELNNFKNKNILKEEFEKFYLTNHSISELNKIYTKNYTEKEARELFILDNKNLPFKFTKLVTDVLNELEYICMYISSQSAGTYFIYQSLHQIFLKTVKVLAVTIAHSNKNYTDKYYTNIIYVYKEWQTIRKRDEKREKKNKLKAFKYLEPKIRRV